MACWPLCYYSKITLESRPFRYRTHPHNHMYVLKTFLCKHNWDWNYGDLFPNSLVLKYAYNKSPGIRLPELVWPSLTKSICTGFSSLTLHMVLFSAYCRDPLREHDGFTFNSVLSGHMNCSKWDRSVSQGWYDRNTDKYLCVFSQYQFLLSKSTKNIGLVDKHFQVALSLPAGQGNPGSFCSILNCWYSPSVYQPSVYHLFMCKYDG